MMCARFIGVVHSPTARRVGLAQRITAEVRAGEQMVVAHDDARLTLVTAGPSPLLVTRNGFVLGELFRSGGSEPVPELSVGEQHEVRATRGGALIKHFWGPYVAILADPLGRIDIVRAPLGALPCLFCECDGTLVFASDVDLLERFGGYSPTLDWGAVARELAARAIKQPQTCLTGVRELAGGERLEIEHGAWATEALWSPWHFAQRASQIDNEADAIQRVRDSVTACVAARAARFDRILLTLSGGLDSSVVAACLAMEARNVTCITLVMPEAGGDERRYARAVADHLHLPLIERASNVDSIDVRRSDAARLPRPSARLFNQDYDRAAETDFGSAADGAIFNGGGGDNVFCSLRSVGPAADRLLTSGFDQRFWKTATDISLLAPASLWTVCTAAMRRAWRRSSTRPQLCDTRFLSAAASQAAHEAPRHPWLDVPCDVLPGKAAHVALLATAQSYVESLDSHGALVHVAPLLSQPVVEACLRIPTWLWFDNGQNRVIPRRAFAAELPPMVIDRRSKGSPDSFSAAIFEANRKALRALLLGGILVEKGLIDTAATAQVLEQTGPLRGEDFHRLLHFADAEAWLRCWHKAASPPANSANA